MLRSKQWKMLDFYKRKLFLKFELKNLILKSLIKNTKNTNGCRYAAFWNKSKITKIYSKTQHKNKCVQTGRVWSVNKKTHYSRFVFRRESNWGNLPGFKRASW